VHLGLLGERNFRVFAVAYAAALPGSAMAQIALAFAVPDTGVSAVTRHDPPAGPAAPGDPAGPVGHDVDRRSGGAR
jgi:hypothetical protein